MKITYRLYPVMRADKKRADGSYPIYFFLRVGGTTIKIPTGKNVMPNEWNKKENTAKLNSQKGIALASFLNKRITDFNSYMLTEEAMGKEVTLQLAQKFFDSSDKFDFYQFWDAEIERWQGEKKYNTLKSYLTTYRILKTISPKLWFSEVDLSFVQRLEHHLITVRKNSTGGRFTKHKVLRSMINQAIAKKYMKYNPYKDFKFKQAKANRMFLNIEEVEKVMNISLPPNNKNLTHARQFFLFGSLTGLRWGDIVDLKFGDIKSNPDRIEIVMNKTSKPITIPLLPKAKEIITSYQNLCIVSNEKTIFPNIANATINKKLKELMKFVGIEKYITQHSSRYTFATTHIQAKTSLIHLKTLLGHETLEQTLQYSNALKEDLFISMDNLNNMYNQQKVS